MSAIEQEWPDVLRRDVAIERVGAFVDRIDKLQRRELTPRERDVLEGISRGLSYAQTASALGVSLETVKTHLKGARHALRARNTVQAVAEAIRRGAIE